MADTVPLLTVLSLAEVVVVFESLCDEDPESDKLNDGEVDANSLPDIVSVAVADTVVVDEPDIGREVEALAVADWVLDVDADGDRVVDGVPDSEAEALGLSELEVDEVDDPLQLLLEVEDGVEVRLMVAVDDGDPLPLTVPVGVDVGDAEEDGVLDGLAPKDNDIVGVMDTLALRLWLGETVVLGLTVTLTVPLADTEDVGVELGHRVRVEVVEGELLVVAEPVPDGDPDGVEVRLVDTLRLVDPEPVIEVEGVMLAAGVLLMVWLLLGDNDGVGVAVVVGVPVVLLLLDRDWEALMVGVRDKLGVTLTVGDIDGVADADPELEALSQM